MTETNAHMNVDRVQDVGADTSVKAQLHVSDIHCLLMLSGNYKIYL